MVFSQCASAIAESYMSGNTENFNNTNDNKHFKMLFVLILWLVVTLTVGMWLWNNVLAKVCTIVKPMTSIWQFLGLALIVDLLLPKCC
jgi:uncharacterized membrane protein YidH (DUF202 family)